MRPRGAGADRPPLGSEFFKERALLSSVGFRDFDWGEDASDNVIGGCSWARVLPWGGPLGGGRDWPDGRKEGVAP